MRRSKSAPEKNKPKPPNEVPGTDVRAICRRVSPYIIHQWRGVCEELGVPDATLDQLEARQEHMRPSELAFQGLCSWHDRVGKNANREKLRRVLRLWGLKRAEAELDVSDDKRTVPYLGRSHQVAVQDVPVNVQAKQKALADRLSRPKSTASEGGGDQKKQAATTKPGGVNPLGLQITPSKPNEICEVKFKITVKGVQKNRQDEVQSTKDDFSSTKDDFKHTCHTFVRLVMANQKVHFKELKELLGFPGISMTRLNRIGFNVNVFILCFNLGSFEILYQAYTTGRLKHLIQTSLVSKRYLEKLGIQQLDLSITLEENMVNKYRDILMVRGVVENLDSHPTDLLDNWEPQTDNANGDDKQEELDELTSSFDMKTSQEMLETSVEVLQNRHDALKAATDEFLMTLRIAKPANTNELTSLQDMLDNYHFLRKSKNVRSGVRTDLLYEYLAIVNHVRLEISRLRDNDVYIAFDEALSPTTCGQFCRLLENTEAMLEPTFPFEMDNEEPTHALVGMDRETFGGLLWYIPALLDNLTYLCDFLKSAVPSEDGTTDDDTEASSSTSQTDEPDECSESLGIHRNCCRNKRTISQERDSRSVTSNGATVKENAINKDIHTNDNNCDPTNEGKPENGKFSKVIGGQNTTENRTEHTVRCEIVDRNNGCA